ncbi:Transcriptional activator protein DAL81 [Tolypocladium paradoxum]|uniref:Transcriptional activator protein DAL81 n=1 Tax=Tolypocladium paradoxum TaxID=94208 RepID=A0A2S4KZF0_9HYPO|nr:Transcriptional activator protein DAL81 [Tolypocladium paradoxum]
MSGAGGVGDSPSATATTKAPHPPRSRPCDTCRLRKTRCAKEGNRSQCVLCAFHGQRCTFLRGPLPRQHRRQTQDRDKAPNRRSVDGHDGAEQQPRGGNGARPRRASPRQDEHGAASSDQVDRRHSRSPSNTWQHFDSTAGEQGLRASPPAILNDTLGLDLATHAEYVGPTDYRDPILLDLHRPRPRPPPSSDALASTPSELARRLDDQTIFIVRPDEAAASETQRIADLDAIEEAVHPLGRTLVDLYFRIVHPSFPILHKDVFISKHRISHRHFAPSLLAAVYLMALDWQIYDSVLAGRESESIPDAAALENLAERNMGQDMRRPKLSTIEAGLLLLQRHRRHAESGSHATLSRTFAAQMVAVAQDLGLHLDCSSWSIPTWEMGLRRRLAWALYMQDRWGAFVHGRPFLIHEEDWDVKPCSDSDFPELVSSEPPSTGVDLDARNGWQIFVCHIELAQLLTDILPTFYSAKATRMGATLDRTGVTGATELAQPLALRLREWYARLPGTLQLQSRQRGKLCANGSLHLAYASMEITIHRALVRALTPHTTDALRNAVRSAAQCKVQSATELLASLEPEHTAAFWGRAAAHQAAHIGSLAALLWATAETTDEMAWCAARVDELRWALRVRGTAAPFARDALRLLEHDIGGFGVVRNGPETPI